MSFGPWNRRQNLLTLRSAFFGSLACVLLTNITVAQERTWTDRTGNLTLIAELVEQQEGLATLRKSDGSTISVPIANLSAGDRQYLRTLPEGKQNSEIADAMESDAVADAKMADVTIKEDDEDSGSEEAGADDAIRDADASQAKPPKNSRALVTGVARDFYESLRDTDRTAVAELLTQTARKAIEEAKESPLDQLPKPAPGNRSVIVAKPTIDGSIAEVPVRVRVERELQSTKLHLRYENQAWSVFAISAEHAGGEKSIDFEADPRKVGSLESLVGKKMPLTGITASGKALDMSVMAGKVVLVDFWATWSRPYRKEMTNIAANYQQYHKHGFEVVAISIDNDLSALANFAVKNPVPWTLVADNHPQASEKMATKYGIQSIPAFVLIGRDGKVADVNCHGKRLGPAIEAALNAGGE